MEILRRHLRESLLDFRLRESVRRKYGGHLLVRRDLTDYRDIGSA